jgi:hypothetical protein
VGKYDLEGDTWYHKFSVHQAWGEHDEDAVHYGHTTGPLLACIDGDAKPARILLFNPAHLRYPDPDTLRPPRFDGTNTEWEPIDIRSRSGDRSSGTGQGINIERSGQGRGRARIVRQCIWLETVVGAADPTASTLGCQDARVKIRTAEAEREQVG